MKILINSCYGGFGLKRAVYQEMMDNGASDLVFDEFSEEFRSHPKLIEIAERDGLKEIADEYATLAIVDIPDDIKWYLEINDNGCEVVHEIHRVWGA